MRESRALDWLRWSASRARRAIARAARHRHGNWQWDDAIDDFLDLFERPAHQQKSEL